jgi:hypothetical protein
MPTGEAKLYKQQVAKRIKLGSLILFPLGNSQLSYLHFIGPGIYGDAVRVLVGAYWEPLEIDDVIKLSREPERFIAQTFVRSVVEEIPGTEVVEVVELRKSWEIAPYWVVSPARANFLDRWVVHWEVNSDGTQVSSDTFRMADFVDKHPDVDASNLPGTDVVGEGLLQDMIRSAWKPAYGDFLSWEQLQRR